VQTDPTPAEIDFLEGGLYESNSQATGIVDGLAFSKHGRSDADPLSTSRSRDSGEQR